MALFKPGTPFLNRLRDLFVGTADPADDTAGDFIQRVRKAITSAAVGYVGYAVAWFTAKTGLEIPVEWYEPFVAGAVGSFFQWAATYFPWNRKPGVT